MIQSNDIWDSGTRLARSQTTCLIDQLVQVRWEWSILEIQGEQSVWGGYIITAGLNQRIGGGYHKLDSKTVKTAKGTS
jgi:hypothetical protein